MFDRKRKRLCALFILCAHLLLHPPLTHANPYLSDFFKCSHVIAKFPPLIGQPIIELYLFLPYLLSCWSYSIVAKQFHRGRWTAPQFYSFVHVQEPKFSVKSGPLLRHILVLICCIFSKSDKWEMLDKPNEWYQLTILCWRVKRWPYQKGSFTNKDTSGSDNSRQSEHDRPDSTFFHLSLSKSVLKIGPGWVEVGMGGVG